MVHLVTLRFERRQFILGMGFLLQLDDPTIDGLPTCAIDGANEHATLH